MAFPMDWNQWRADWEKWRAEHADALQPSSYDFGPGKNVLADAVLGKWSINGRAVELSEYCLFEKRFVGVTFGAASGHETDVVDSFAGLEAVLGIG